MTCSLTKRTPPLKAEHSSKREFLRINEPIPAAKNTPPSPVFVLMALKVEFWTVTDSRELVKMNLKSG